LSLLAAELVDTGQKLALLLPLRKLFFFFSEMFKEYPSELFKEYP
jgi:hypothetical protein